MGTIKQSIGALCFCGAAACRCVGEYKFTCARAFLIFIATKYIFKNS